MPLTSIYSRGDGVVWWEACLVPYARCAEVERSQLGLPFNRKAYRAIAQVLAGEAPADAGEPQAGAGEPRPPSASERARRAR